MHRVCAEVDGARWAEEVVQTDACLRCEVPDASIGIWTVVAKVQDGRSEGGKLMVRPKDAAGGLGPRRDTSRTSEVPPEDDGRDGDAREGAPNCVKGRAGDEPGRGGWEAFSTLKFGGVCPPEGEEFDGVLEVATQGAGAMIAGEHLARVNSCHKKSEVITVVRDTLASLEDGPHFEREGCGGGLGGRGDLSRAWHTGAEEECQTQARDRTPESQLLHRQD